ncbi:MAG: tetratricopeptide repeat protein [Pseudohongiellaceae bacterium]|nr:tetratricopeptide repeat protein [Pseudohongiellaceae bacterium]
MKQFSRHSLALAISLGLAACQSLPAPEPMEQSPQSSPQTEAQAEPEPIAYRNFTPDELSRTLLNELGGHRGHLLDATTDYVALAKETRDIAIIRRASQFAAALGDTNSLIELSQIWTEEEPNSVEPHRTLAYQLIESGQFLAAIDELQKVLELGGRIDFSTIATQTEELDFQQRTALINRLSKLNQDLPISRSLHYSLIQLLEQNQQAEEAMAQLELYRDKYGPSARSTLIEAQLLLQMEQPDEALAVLRSGIIDYPEHQLMRFNYARVLVQTEDLVEARKQFSELSEMAPDDFETMYSLALLDLELGDTATAKQLLTRILSAGYRANDAHFYLAYIGEEEGDIDTAITHYQQVRTDSNNFINAQRQAIRLLVQSNRVTQAHNWVLQVSNGNPRLQALLTTIEADTLAETGHTELAISVLSNAIEKYPSDLDLLFARAILFEREGNMQAQEADLNKIIELDPRNARALNHLGYTLLISTQRFEEALALIERAIAVEPEDPAIIDSLGWAQFKLGRYEQALANLERAYENFPDPEVAAHLGETLWVLGRREEAEALWRSSLSENPDSPVLLEVLERLLHGTGS